MSKTITVRLNAEEEKIFNEYAKLQGLPLSTLFKKILEEKLEDEFDLRTIAEYEKDLEDGNIEFVTLEEVMKEQGL